MAIDARQAGARERSGRRMGVSWLSVRAQIPCPTPQVLTRKKNLSRFGGCCRATKPTRPVPIGSSLGGFLQSRWYTRMHWSAFLDSLTISQPTTSQPPTIPNLLWRRLFGGARRLFGGARRPYGGACVCLTFRTPARPLTPSHAHSVGRFRATRPATESLWMFVFSVLRRLFGGARRLFGDAWRPYGGCCRATKPLPTVF
jgi:hypothetical protein